MLNEGGGKIKMFERIYNLKKWKLLRQQILEKLAAKKPEKG
jgi:hypothetical protein